LLKAKKMHPDAQLPKRAHPTDSGLDLFSCEDSYLKPGETTLIRTGIAIEFPEPGPDDKEVIEGQIRSRSGLAANSSVFVLNSPGTIDNGYRGEIKVILRNSGDEIFAVPKGTRVAQLVPVKVPLLDITEVEQISEAPRGDKGFGSTDKKETL
jgi:dUTP pyrophosphatase